MTDKTDVKKKKQKQNSMTKLNDSRKETQQPT